MTIMGNDAAENSTAESASDLRQESGSDSNEAQKETDSPFTSENLPLESTFSDEDGVSGGAQTFTITPDEKVRFIDAVATNSRYTRDYSLFGGRLSVTVRSLTVEEVNALATWTARVGSDDAAGLVAGRYRKYLAAAQCAMVNGVEIPPLEEPLYARISRDGKTIDEPGWLARGKYFEEMGSGQFQAILNCIKDFDARYSYLCKKAEDSNFWIPDTP